MCKNVLMNEEIIVDCAFEIQELHSQQTVSIQSQQKETFYLVSLEDILLIGLKMLCLLTPCAPKEEIEGLCQYCMFSAFLIGKLMPIFAFDFGLSSL